MTKPTPSSGTRHQLREFYRTSASYRDQLTYHELSSAHYYVNWVSNFVPVGSSILDLGCGTGVSTALLRESAYRSVGMDVSELFMFSNRQISQVETTFVAGDALDLPFAAQTFDAVSSAALIEHLPDVAQALMEMLRVMKPGGLLLILAPNHCSLSMPMIDFAAMLRGKTGRPYFAETPYQAWKWFLLNLGLNLKKSTDWDADFRYVDPDLTLGSGGDRDMVYYASPIDLRRFLSKQGAKIVSWSGVKTKPLRVNGNFRLRGSGIKQQVTQSLFWPFTGMTFVVARKLEGMVEHGI